MQLQKRKGARSIKEIPAEIIQQLNTGKIETANLVEWLAIDARKLLENLLNEWGKIHFLQPILSDVENLKKQTINTVNEAIGVGLFKQAKAHKDDEILKKMANHPSDSVRCWATYTIGKNPNLSVAEILEAIKPFAADTHFGVREIAWLSVRPVIAKNLEESLVILEKWTTSDSENVRRFASEATRPRGVWCEHIEVLKKNPALALRILEPLKNDLTKYVQDSVGNWLNDASKTQPQFVIELCQKWQKNSPTKATDYIIKKALRSISKKV
jgi:3-methyladenine DNA glycosylase AlkC